MLLMHGSASTRRCNQRLTASCTIPTDIWVCNPPTRSATTAARLYTDACWRYFPAHKALQSQPLCCNEMDTNAPGSARRPPGPRSLVTASEQARFRPWEQQDLLHRLHTFKTRTWFGKPSQINALICARHGWINSGPDKLACEVRNTSCEYEHLDSDHSDRCGLQFCGEGLELFIRPKWSFKDVEKVCSFVYRSLPY